MGIRTVNTRQNTPPHEDDDECRYNRRADTVIVHTESDKYGTIVAKSGSGSQVVYTARYSRRPQVKRGHSVTVQ